MSAQHPTDETSLFGNDSALHLPREDSGFASSQEDIGDDNTLTPITSSSASASSGATIQPLGPAVESNATDGIQERDGDSAYDSESLLGDDTMTLASFITDYRYENGRRYENYRDGTAHYWGPNDEPAKEIQDLAHHMYLLTLNGKLHLAPIDNPHDVLDVGTGTGIWAIDMADQYSSASVVGCDLSPIQPDFVPPNCSFEIDDLTLEWTYPENHFDFIHVREMFGSIPDWDYFLSQCMRCTKPGGWVEIVEHSVAPVADPPLPEDHFYRLWGKVVLEMGQKFGRSFSIWQEAKDRMLKAGFTEVTEVRYKWPMNGWSRERRMKEIGRWNQLRLHEGVEGMMLRLLTTAGGWSVPRAQLHLAEMRQNLKDYNTHAYLEGTVVYGRRPYDS